MQQTDDLLTTEQVARWVRMSAATVTRWARAEHIPAIKTPRAWRFRRSAVEAWLKEREAPV